MKLVVDANILVAALLKNAVTRELLLREDIKFFAPLQLFKELRHLLDNPKIRKRIKLNEEGLKELSCAIFSRIDFVPENFFLAFIKEAGILVSHPEDSPYAALALALKIPLWSNDSALKQQSAIKVFTTLELLKALK